MKYIQASRSDIEQFAAGFYAQGKSALECFDMSWKSLSELEEKVPELTCKTSDEGCKTA
jgi:NAD-dependent DNA ligase